MSGWVRRLPAGDRTGENVFEDLRAHAARVYSEGGEDGAIARLFERIGVGGRHFVEFGAWDGVHLSNTANLRLHAGWRGLLMEGNPPRTRAGVRSEFVTAENIDALLRRYGVPEGFDLLSIDIDGNDYWVWKALRACRPRVVVIEYNIHFAPDDACTIAYRPDHVWDRSHYHGASLAALAALGREKGYALVYADAWSPNAFFVADEVLPRGVRVRPVSEVTPWKGLRRVPDRLGRPWVEVGRRREGAGYIGK